VNQRCILFLISDTGGGHRSAALAIANAIRLKSAGRSPAEGADASAGQVRIEIVEAFEECSRLPLRGLARLYGPASRYTPKLYGLLFYLSNQPGRIIALQRLLSPLMLKGLEQLFCRLQPDVIVSVHPLLNYVTVEALRRLGRQVPFIVVVTDLISAHEAWFTEGVTAYAVPTEEVREHCLRRGLAAERVHLLGMPIDPRFILPTGSRDELRAKLGLAADRPVVLLVGGGEGSGGLRRAVAAISRARLPVQLLVVTGRNRLLFAQLQREQRSWQMPAKVMGFVHNMHELMHAADVIVTKAGPGTICEALACHLPIILSGYVPGQEEGNVDFVERNNVGVLAREPEQLVEALRRLLEPDSPLLQRQIENARLLSRPHAAFAIADLILSHLPQGEQRGPWESSQASVSAPVARVEGG
jgi:1,2-diacylglycerol 3-beta-galactosyltransferase